MDDANKVPVNAPKLSEPQANIASAVSGNTPMSRPSSAPNFLSFVKDVVIPCGSRSLNGTALLKIGKHAIPISSNISPDILRGYEMLCDHANEMVASERLKEQGWIPMEIIGKRLDASECVFLLLPHGEKRSEENFGPMGKAWIAEIGIHGFREPNDAFQFNLCCL